MTEGIVEVTDHVTGDVAAVTAGQSAAVDRRRSGLQVSGASRPQVIPRGTGLRDGLPALPGQRASNDPTGDSSGSGGGSGTRAGEANNAVAAVTSTVGDTVKDTVAAATGAADAATSAVGAVVEGATGAVGGLLGGLGR